MPRAVLENSYCCNATRRTNCIQPGLCHPRLSTQDSLDTCAQSGNCGIRSMPGGGGHAGHFRELVHRDHLEYSCMHLDLAAAPQIDSPRSPPSTDKAVQHCEVWHRPVARHNNQAPSNAGFRDAGGGVCKHPRLPTCMSLILKHLPK